MIVVDASVVVAALLRLRDAKQIETILFDAGHSLHAPHLIDVEIANAFRRFAVREEIDATRGQTMLTLLAAMPIRRYAHRDLLLRAWALRSNVTAYDAMYVALAETLDAPLLTRDRRLASAAGHLIAIDLV